ncbi:hypothetical protein D4764_11G0008320 [Takifugu flavidus]|uniref:Uncharacterized protein n=1 Tax=Takifugu flavidus TaxID=433684 RepID=A0A5C6PIJ4_9TELE|nr:hypothetical protein D4764_11G0008320 [Takifugu flavidus]
MPLVGNSCMGVHCFACQIREQTTSDKAGLEQGQIPSTRWSTMSEPNYLRHATTLLRASGASKGNMGCPRDPRLPLYPPPQPLLQPSPPLLHPQRIPVYTLLLYPATLL